MGKVRKPITNKKNSYRHHNGFRSAMASMQGWRSTMEDTHRMSMKLPGYMKNWAFAGVFDGHGGNKVSEYTSRNILQRILKSIPGNNGENQENAALLTLKESIIKGFLKLDETMRKSKKIDDDSGTTAVCVFLTPNHFYFANCGDSRAVLCRENKVYFATSDHKPYLKAERTRIEAAGGNVRNNRVNGGLALSRALGDFEYKNNANKEQCDQMVSPLPDVTVLERNNETDHFIVLACDGVFDVMSNYELISFIKSEMTKTENLKVICNNVVDQCLKKGSTDNMSVVIITLPGCPKPEDLQRKRKMDLKSMHKTIYCKKDERLKLRVDNCQTTNNTAIIAPNLQVMLNKSAGVSPTSSICNQNNFVPNSFIRFYLDYLKTHRGNICRVAKACGRRWAKVDKCVKVKYRRRYLYAKRKGAMKRLNPVHTLSTNQIPK